MQPLPQPPGPTWVPARGAPVASDWAEFGAFVRRQAIWAVVIAVASLGATFLGSRGLIRDRMYEPIFDGVVLGVIAVVLGSALTGWWGFDTDRPGSGIPRRWLGLAVFLGALPWGIAPPAAMLAWPYLLRGGEHPWHVDASLPMDAAGLVIVAMLLWAGASLGMAFFLPLAMEIHPLWLRVLFVLPFLALIIGLPWWGAVMIDGSITALDGVLVVALAVFSLVASQVIAALVVWLERRSTPMAPRW